jgi:hypothetical protein
MATNLTREDIARIMSGQAVGPNEYYDPQSGRTYTFRNGDGRYEGDTYIQGDPMEMLATDWAPGRFKDNAEMNGQSMDRYGMGGDYLGSETITGLKDRNQFMDIAKIFAAPVAMYGLQAAGLLGGAGSAAGGSGFSLAGSDAAFNAALANSGGASLMGSSAGMVGLAGSNAAFDSALAGGMGTDGIALAAGDGAFNSGLAAAGGAGGMGGAGGAAGGLLSGLGKGAGGLIATGLGALAGSQGQENEQTSARKTDPRVDPYLFGNDQMQGLMNATQARLMADQGQQGLWESMKSKGMGLLNSEVAPNGFGLFTKGRY